VRGAARPGGNGSKTGGVVRREAASLRYPGRVTRGLGRLLVVRCGERRVALPGASLVRVVGATTVTPVPGSSPEVLGVAQVEGEPVLVLDLARMVGEIPAASASVPAGVQIRVGPADEDETVVLAVDEAEGFVRLPTEAVEPAGEGEGPFTATVAVDGESVAVLDPARLGGEAG